MAAAQDQTSDSGSPPPITKFSDLGIIETFSDSERLKTRYTTCYVFKEDDTAYFGQVFKKKLEIKLGEFASSLERIPDEEIYPEIPPGAEITDARKRRGGGGDEVEGRKNLYVKRPSLTDYEDEAGHEWIRKILLSEALIMERIFRGGQQHPNLVRYHGCRVRGNRIAGIVMDQHGMSVNDYLREGKKLRGEPKQLVDKVESAVRHLHGLGLAHNDVNPNNVMLKEGGGEAEAEEDVPVLIDFGSCQPFGERTMQAGTTGWCKDLIFFSEKEHDFYGLEKMRSWLEDEERVYL
ncbi:uncharacterized protein MKZ38_005902 [Zalerion maritima]|uniref:Protein kinase domain-containing protein n=1 Tax=Zalerion maritima TaxID=339359 RepID=A0AAD5RJJ0_9PEZI|nr:uncharacterized protein MKZ38_005902 [Zalerion maritima]